MPRAEKGTPKYLANKMKAKGLQKLRWYCQMCQKQCRDENGFKCHTMSESHQRQLLLFADNSKRFIDDFSFEFAKGYIQILRRQYGGKRVNANRVYQEYIADKNHVHMNGTRWVTLTGFVKWMGRTGKCLVDETEKGWFITYIEKDPDQIEKEERKNKKLKMDKTDDEKTLEFITKQAELCKEQSTSVEPLYTDLQREGEESLKLDIKLETKPNISANSTGSIFKKPLDRDTKIKKEYDSKKKTSLDELKEEQEKEKERKNRKDYWLVPNIVVKIVTKKCGEEFYKQKGVVKDVLDKYVAVVKLLDSGKKLKIDQSQLETVIPSYGKPVRIVNGAYRGEKAILDSINEKNFCVNLEIASGLLMGRKISGIQYEDICKIHED